MTVTIIRIMIALGIVGHAINMYCDRIISVFPNGTIKFNNFKEIGKDGVLADIMRGVSPDVPMRSAVLGAFSLVLQFLSYCGLSIYTYEQSPILGAIMFVMCAFFCIVASGHHVKCGVAEYVFLKSGCDNRAKELTLDLLSSGTILRVCFFGLIIYLIALVVAIVTGVIGFPIWALLFTIVPVFIIMFPFRIIGTLHIAAMVSMLAWIFLV